MIKLKRLSLTVSSIILMYNFYQSALTQRKSSKQASSPDLVVSDKRKRRQDKLFNNYKHRVCRFIQEVTFDLILDDH